MDDYPDPALRKKPKHTSGREEVGNFADFALVQLTRSVHPMPVWDDVADAETKSDKEAPS